MQITDVRIRKIATEAKKKLIDEYVSIVELNSVNESSIVDVTPSKIFE